jgi:hypothetical protein
MKLSISYKDVQTSGKKETATGSVRTVLEQKKNKKSYHRLACKNKEIGAR